MAERQWMSTKEIIKGFAPMTPARFRERVERGHHELPEGLVLKFTHRSDEDIVVNLQEKIFVQQAQKLEGLLARSLPESEFLFLAESIPHFVNLQHLILDDIEIREPSAMGLIAGLKNLRHFTRLTFSNSCSIEEEAATSLAQGLLECRFPADLRVKFSSSSGLQKLANELRSGRVDEKYYDQHQTFDFTIKAAGWQFGWFGRFSICCT